MQNKLFALTFPLLVATALSARQKPNVLFIAIDDLNDWVGCMGGHPQAYTPNIDRLAAQGTLFTNAHCQAPICGPSRASIMTGIYPSRSGNYLQLNDQEIKKSNDIVASSVFLPEHFESHGYKTMAVGKIYHNGDGAKTFREYGGVFEKFGPKPEKRMKYDPAWFGDVGGTQTDWGAYPDHDSLMPDYKSAEWAKIKLSEVHDKPFFLAVGFVRPHVPYHVPQKWFDMFPVEQIVTPPYKKDDFDDIPEMGRRVNHAPMMPTTEWLIEKDQWRGMLQGYLACVAFVDAQVGKVLEALENSPYAANTIVVLWSDHGYSLGEKNRSAKQSLWDRSTRAPLIIKDLNTKPGQKCPAPVQLIDMYPTLIDLCDLSKLDYLDGNSLAPLLENPGKKWNHSSKVMYGEGNIALVGQRYRLIQYEDGAQEFYDLKKDPNEWYNLAGKKRHRKTIEIMQKDMPGHWAKNSAYSVYPFNEYFRQKYPSAK
jgi:arylsulfatase A-like enzyme